MVSLLSSSLSSEHCQSSLLSNTNQGTWFFLDYISLHLLHPQALLWVTQAPELWLRVSIQSLSLSRRFCTCVCVFLLSYTLTMEFSDPNLASVADWTPTSISPLFHFSNRVSVSLAGHVIIPLKNSLFSKQRVWPRGRVRKMCKVTYATSRSFFVCLFWGFLVSWLIEYMLPVVFFLFVYF